MQITLIAHVYNEEDLLPYWLKHHKQLFTHGIILDQDCTDNSMAIVREICPTWEIIRYLGNAYELERKVMEIEQSVSGWKMCLNIPEFLVRSELSQYIQSLDPTLMGVRASGYIINETPEERMRGLTMEPLLLQRFHGYRETKAMLPIDNFRPLRPRLLAERNRLLHCYPDGSYDCDRHWSAHDQLCPVDPNLPLAWFGWGLPDIKKKRNVNVISRLHINRFNGHHLWTSEEVEQNWLEEQKIIEDLRNHPYYHIQLYKILALKKQGGW